MNKEIIDAIKSTKSVDELKDLAKKNGYNLTDKDAEGYFEMYHTSGKIDDNELDNVSGGACYSTDEHGMLITTDLNSCDGFKPHPGLDDKNPSKFCKNCEFMVSRASYPSIEASFKRPVVTVDLFTSYCLIRRRRDDPYR